MSTEAIRKATEGEYKYGFSTDIESDSIPAGLNEDVVRLISHKKNEPEWLLDWRLKAYHAWASAGSPSISTAIAPAH